MSPREPRTGESRQAVRYPPHNEMWAELNRRVDAYFAESGKGREGGRRLWVKTGLIFAWLIASYALLVFWAGTWWQAVPLAILFSLAVAGVGFNIQHDGGHDAYARTRFGNKVAGWALDLVGGSSYVWRFKHTIVHHHYTNIEGVDEDINAAPFLRLSPLQPRRFYHRFQHWYAWVLFGFLPPKWMFWDDIRNVAAGSVGRQPMPRPKGLDLAVLIGGKAFYMCWAFVVPLLAGHSLGVVLGFYAFHALTAGVVLAIVFQLAHCVEEAEFDDPPEAGERMPRSWSEHQIATTVDFAPNNRFLTWYLGGLNFQVEHHLFPRVSHVHYPALVPIVRRTCSEYGLRHRAHPTFRSAVASHVRHMRTLGRRAG